MYILHQGGGKSCVKTNTGTGHESLTVQDSRRHVWCKSYYGFGLSLDTRDSNAYVSRAKRRCCYAKTATFPRANFLVWSMVIRLFTF